jgi:hypothetical protein
MTARVQRKEEEAHGSVVEDRPNEGSEDVTVVEVTNVVYT